jgi:hypothetical protein
MWALSMAKLPMMVIRRKEQRRDFESVCVMLHGVTHCFEGCFVDLVNYTCRAQVS